ncbi:hypothetical protein BRD12_01635 [Halobacteriales archaeon SW_12_67_38]|nr:MAG: hypothetical protein BRC80_02375 [Halobacteriales archaeon QH_9_66_26]PSQ54471.1 MAG: hypothetical protein BRD12_01635 [Halobacteriales archaeon SW_12_67_38]
MSRRRFRNPIGSFGVPTARYRPADFPRRTVDSRSKRTETVETNTVPYPQLQDDPPSDSTRG